MLAIQERGSATIGTYAFAEASELVAEVTVRARHSEFPLRVSIVPAAP